MSQSNFSQTISCLQVASQVFSYTWIQALPSVVFRRRVLLAGGPVAGLPLHRDLGYGDHFHHPLCEYILFMGSSGNANEVCHRKTKPVINLYSVQLYKFRVTMALVGPSMWQQRAGVY